MRVGKTLLTDVLADTTRVHACLLRANKTQATIAQAPHTHTRDARTHAHTHTYACARVSVCVAFGCFGGG